ERKLAVALLVEHVRPGQARSAQSKRPPPFGVHVTASIPQYELDHVERRAAVTPRVPQGHVLELGAKLPVLSENIQSSPIDLSPRPGVAPRGSQAVTTGAPLRRGDTPSREQFRRTGCRVGAERGEIYALEPMWAARFDRDAAPQPGRQHTGHDVPAIGMR